MKHLLVVLTVLFSGSLVLAQTDGKGKISGTVLDESNKKPVEFATIALTEVGSDRPINGAVADDKGKFLIKGIAPGNYQVVISFIGYKTTIIDVTLSDKKEDFDLGTVAIESEAAVLSEVTVEAQKAVVEERVDRTIYNAENDATARGGDATDVLRRVPMLSVDMDGNVSLRGNSNITVLINNKPSTIIAANVADAIKQIPADQIKSVEVITSPSAKYDAEGSAGIINIITKKNSLQGLTLGIDAGAGYRGSNLGLNGNYRKGKMGFSLGGWGRANYNINGSFQNSQQTRSLTDPTDPNSMMLTRQSADTRSNGLFGNYNLGFDYDINDKNFITASARFGVRNHNNYQDNLLSESFRGANQINYTLRDAVTNDLSNNIGLNFTYTHLYAKPQQELSFQALYSRNNRNNDFQNVIIDAQNYQGPDRIKNLNDNFNQEVTLQVDYQTPVSDNQMLELGGKNITRKVFSNFIYLEAFGEGAFQPSQRSSLSNNLNYDQNVMAGYTSYTISSKTGYSLKGGLRYEYTTITAYTQTEDNFQIPSYGALVPSVNASRRLKNGKTIKASYNRRIQRPSIRFLNPNIQAANPLNITYGNPELDPEFTNNFELGYSTFIKGTSINVTGYARNTNSAIQQVTDILQGNKTPGMETPDTVRNTFQNIGRENAYGTSIFANVNIGKLTLNGGGDVYYAMLDNNVPNELYRANNEGWVVNGRMFGSYNLNKGWAFQFFGFFRGRQVQLQGYQTGFRMYSLGLRKEFNEKRGSIGFGAENFLTPSIRIRNETVSRVITQNSVNKINNLSFRVNFSYRIGKMNASQQPRNRRSRSINNDDLKEGGGNDMTGIEGQGGQGGGMQRGGGGFNPGMQRPAAPPKDTPPADPTAEVNAEGKWNYTIESPQGGEGVITIRKEGEEYAGTILNKRFNNETPLTDVKLNGNELSFSYQVSFGGNTMVLNVKGIITDDTLNGNITVGQFGTFPLTAKRAEQ